MKGLLYSILVVLSLVGCASGLELSEEEERVLIQSCMGDNACLFAERASMVQKKKDIRDYDRIEKYDIAFEKYKAREASCYAHGYMWIVRPWMVSRIKRPLTRSEMAFAKCATGIQII